MKFLEAIDGTITLLSSPKAWCKQAMATDANGVGVFTFDNRACKWCVSGALDKVCKSLEPLLKDSDTLYNILRAHIIHRANNYQVDGQPHGYLGSLPHWNDLKTTTHKEIMSVLYQVRDDAAQQVSRQAATA